MNSKSTATRVVMLDTMARAKQKNKKPSKKSAELPNIEPVKPKPLKHIHEGAKANPPEKQKNQKKKKPSKSNVPNPY